MGVAKGGRVKDQRYRSAKKMVIDSWLTNQASFETFVTLCSFDLQVVAP
jgi:hypothetical protein